MTFSFDNPLLAAAAFIIIPLTILILSRLKNPFVASIPLGAPGGTPFKTTQVGPIVKCLKVLEIIGVFLLFLSAAEPLIKTSDIVWLNRGADIIFILDASPSMAAIDMDGKNRFNTARTLITDFAQKRPADNIGLIAVGEDVSLLIPPTHDREALINRLEQLRIGELGDGTALGVGIATAAYHLEKSNAKRKAAVLITDGENNAGSIHPETAAALLRDTGSTFWVIAVGSAGEVPIDYIDPYTRIRRTGIFDSRYNIDSLRELSLAGGGTFIAAASLDAFNSAFSRLDEAELTIQRSRIVNRKRALSLSFLIPAIIILIAVRFIMHNILGHLKHRKKLPSALQRKLTLSLVCFILFLFFSAIALSDFRHDTGITSADYSRGLDVVYAIDISRSMDIRDVQSDTQTRLERGLSIAEEAAINVTGVRFAAVTGRNRGYLAVPLIYENDAILSFLQTVDVQSVTGRSTNLEALLETAANCFMDSSPARKVIVLISDGETHAGNIKNAITRCAREGISITTVATGSEEGRPVSSDPAAISKRETAVMRSVAQRTGGIYIDANREDAASALSSYLKSLTTGTAQDRAKPKQRHTIFILISLIAYGAYKFTLRSPLKNKLLLASLILITFTFTGCPENKLLLLQANYLTSKGRYEEALVPYQKALNYEDSAPYAEYGLGLAFHSLDDSFAALNRYTHSAQLLEKLSEEEHRELRYRVIYNTGIIFFEQDDFHSAALAFKEALRAEPGRIEAKRNLELALMSITMESGKDTRPSNTYNEAREILFNLIKQNEEQKWKSGEWAPEEKFTGNDW